MQSIYQLHTSELDEQFLVALQQLFGDKRIQIVVSEMDETAYLYSSAANHDRLMHAIHEIDNGENLIAVDLSQHE